MAEDCKGSEVAKKLKKTQVQNVYIYISIYLYTYILQMKKEKLKKNKHNDSNAAVTRNLDAKSAGNQGEKGGEKVKKKKHRTQQ